MIPHAARPFLVMLFLCGLILLVTGLVEGCGPSARDKALSETLVAVNSARDGFLAWDKAKQDAIVDGCKPATGCSLEQGQAQLDAFRAKLEPVEASFAVAYQAIALGAINSSTPLPTILSAAKDVLDSLEALKASVDRPTVHLLRRQLTPL